MPRENAGLWTTIVREMRALASLSPLFFGALLLAWLLSGGGALSFFQAPTSPLPATESPVPTPSATETEVRPTSSATPPEAPPTLTPTAPPTPPAAEPTATAAVPSPSAPPAEPTATATVPPTSTPAEDTPAPAVEVTAPATAKAAEPRPSEGAISLRPWILVILLGLASLAAIAAGIFLLRREAPPREGGQ